MITLTGAPQSTNNIYKYRCAGQYPRMYMTSKGKELKEQYYWEAKSQWKGAPLQEEVALNIILYFPDKRTRDIDNYGKILLDSLTGVVWEDDSQITEMHVFKEIDRDNPRIEVTIA